MIHKKKSAWIYGIIGSTVSIYLFLLPEVKLYSEVILYSYYIIIGIYAWVSWSKEEKETNKIVIIEKNISYHLILLLFGSFLGFLLGFYFHQYTDANNPFLDASSTIFSFIATYLQAKKVLSSWLYWIFINLFTIYLYGIRGLDIYSMQMVIYAIFSFWGFYNWLKVYK